MKPVVVKRRKDWRTAAEIKNYFNDTFGNDVFFLMRSKMINLPNGLDQIFKTSFFRYIIIVVQFYKSLQSAIGSGNRLLPARHG